MNCLVPGSKFYLFKPSDNNEAQHWRSDGHNVRMDMPKGNPVVTEIYFYLETEQGINKEFRKQVFSKMNSSLGSFLLHYIGDEGFADHKSSYLYENLPVQTKMAILSRRMILLAILLYEQFIHYTQINLCPNKQPLSTQQHAYQSFLRYFLL